MIAETKRIRIRLGNLADSSFFQKLMNSPNWITFIGDRGIHSEDLAKDYIQKSLINRYKTNGYGLYKIALKKTDTPIGICGFVKREYLQHADIGFAVPPEYEDYGYTYEAAKAILEYGKIHLKLHPILGLTTAENLRRELLHKIGLLEIGTIKPSDSALEFLLFSNE